MLTVCWSPKGGSGTSVVAAALALTHAAAGHDALLVDLGGDQPALLGCAASDRDGLTDWLAAAGDVPIDALANLEVPVVERLHLLPRGGAAIEDLPPERLELAAEVFATSGREIVVDAGPTGGADDRWMRNGRLVVVLRPCYLAVSRLLRACPLPADSVLILIEEPGRALDASDVTAAIDVASVVRLSWDPAVARAVDAGLLTSRMPRSLRRLRSVVAP